MTKDGKPISEVHLKNNTRVIISIVAANTSEAVWGEDAKEWKPERWLGHNQYEYLNADGFGTYKEHDEEKQPKGVAKIQLPGVYSGMYVG